MSLVQLIYQTRNQEYGYNVKTCLGIKMAVAILNNSDNVTNDDIKEQFQKYSKVFDDSLNNKEIDEYWDKMLSGKNKGKS